MADANFSIQCLHIIPRQTAKSLGMVHYFSINACPKGHRAERYTSTGQCVFCLAILSSSKAKKEYDRAYYKKNSGRILEQMRERHPLVSAQKIQSAREWALANPEKRRVIANSYKARRRTVERRGDSTAAIFAWTVSAQKICHWCGDKCKDAFHVDHYQPLSKGGAHALGNLVIACPKCNLKKSSKDPYEFAAQVGRLF